MTVTIAHHFNGSAERHLKKLAAVKRMMDVDICHLALQKVMIQIIPTGQDRWE